MGSKGSGDVPRCSCLLRVLWWGFLHLLSLLLGRCCSCGEALWEVGVCTEVGVGRLEKEGGQGRLRVNCVVADILEV